MLAGSRKNISRAPNITGPRCRVGLELDQQRFEIIDSWARRQGFTFAEIMDQATRQIAGRIERDLFYGARQLRFDRSLEDLDLRIQINLKDQENLDRSIPKNSQSCGNLRACEVDQGRAVLPFAGSEAERRNRILEWYGALTGNKPRPNDARAVAKVSHLSDLTIQAGILHALNYSTRAIGSFAYCVTAIENFSSHNGGQLKAVVKSLILKLQARQKRGQILLPLEGERLLIGEFNHQEDRQ